MAKLLTCPMRIVKSFINCIVPSTFFLVSTRRFNPEGKCFYVKATSVLFKDSCQESESRDRAESSKSAGNPCQSKSIGTENVCDSTTASSAKNPCANTSIASDNHSKKSASPVAESSSNVCKPYTDLRSSPSLNDPCSRICNSQTTSRASCESEINSRASSPLDNSCERDCKLSSPPLCCEKTSTLGPCPESPPSTCDKRAKKARFWKRATLYGALPIVLLASIIIRKRAQEEAMSPRQEYVPMEYLYRRTKRFPWGDGNHTFFHNPVKNAVPPDGYEVEDPYAVKSE